jgi:hypothetical protein
MLEIQISRLKSKCSIHEQHDTTRLETRMGTEFPNKVRVRTGRAEDLPQGLILLGPAVISWWENFSHVI